MKWGYVFNRNQNGLFDYKEHCFFRSDESLYVVEIKDDEVYDVVEVFFDEHRKFFEKLAERFAENFYSKDEILHDFNVILYEYIYSHRKEINPFLEYHKSMIFLHVKREMSKKFYERKTEYNNYEHVDIVEDKDVNYVYHNVTEDYSYSSLSDDFYCSFDDEDFVEEVVHDVSFDVKRVLKDILDDKSLLFFVLNFCSNKKKLSSEHLELTYEISSIYSKQIYQKVKSCLKRKFFAQPIRAKKTLIDYFSDYHDEFDRKLIIIDEYYFHTRISYLNDVDSLYEWELRFLKRISLSQEYRASYFFDRKRFSLKFLNFLYNCYRQIYNPIGYYFYYFPERDSFMLKYNSPLVFSSTDVEDELLKNSVNRFYSGKSRKFN